MGSRTMSLSVLVGCVLASTLTTGCIITPAPEPAPAYQYQQPAPSYSAPPPSYAPSAPPPRYDQAPPPSQAEIIVQVEPPPPQYERMPRPRRGYVWVPGHWEWRPVIGRYDWVPGYWERMHPRYRHYVAGHYERRPGGWVWIAPYWR